MFSFFKKAVAEPAIKAAGFFNTSMNLGSEARVREHARAQTFQRTCDNFVMVDAKGNAIAMDATNMQLQKAAFGGPMDGMPAMQLAYFAAGGFIGYSQCALLAQNWLIDKACTMPARDAARNGFEIIVEDGTEVEPDVLDKLKKMDERMHLKRHMVELVRFSRIFGIRIAMFDVDSTDPEYYEKPFNPDGVTKGSYRGITQIDPYWITPELDIRAASDPAAQDFYEPTWWRINSRRVHRSHLVIVRTCEVPDILKPTYYYGGIPLPQRIAERVYASERTANEAPMLALTKRTTAIHTDIAQAISNQDKFDERMNVWVRYRDNYGVKIMGEQEVIEQFDTSLNDLDAVIMTQYQLVAAIAEIPATKLLGTSPKGFNATGEFEEASYHEMLESIQEHDLTALVNRHHLLCIRSEVAPDKPFNTSVAWKPVDSPTAAELAELNNKKSMTDQNLVNAGAITPMEARDRLINDPDSGYSALESLDEGDLINETEEDPLEPTPDA